jgi:histidinol-phosphate aminotransferase
VSLEFVSRLDQIRVYPAASTYAFGGDLVKLASNETPYAPHPDVLDAMRAALGSLNRYPDPASTDLRRRLAERFGLPGERIAVGNGSCDLLLAAAEAMLEPGAEIVYAWPSFSMYPHLAAMTGARAIPVSLDADGRHDLEAMAGEVTAATRIVIVCNPNNPTATTVGLDALESFLSSLPAHVAVIVDEAYIEFAVDRDPDDSLPLLARHANLVLLRTFSKVYGLCGLRAGYALAGADAFRLAVDRVRQPFSVNALAQAAAAEALLHQDEVASRVERTVAERLFLDAELAERGLATSDGHANFCWVRLGDHPEADVVEGLARRGVIVRSGHDLGAEGHMRVTFGTHRENQAFLAALDQVLGETADT